jgi:hypothetical protein
MSMKNIFTALSMVAALSIPAMASAREDSPDQLRLGPTFDLATPSGAALGAVAELPYMHFIKWNVSATYLLSPGVKGGVMVDPIRFPVAPVLDLDLGYQPSFTVPGVASSPSASFSYQDVRAGIALGRRDFVRFFILVGETHFDGSASNLQGTFTLPSGVSISDAHFSGWIPSIKLGLTILF